MSNRRTQDEIDNRFPLEVFSPRLSHALKMSLGDKPRVYQVAALTDRELLRIPNVGRKTLNEFRSIVPNPNRGSTRRYQERRYADWTDNALVALRVSLVDEFEAVNAEIHLRKVLETLEGLK